MLLNVIKNVLTYYIYIEIVNREIGNHQVTIS